MTKIKLLSPEIVSKVAAGEVIEYPAAVVKELVENSIDAGATQIDIEIENLGLTKIRVADNGEGMTLEDLERCYLRHTTSKISKLEDLERITTLGFRGEALHAIAAISHMQIKTKKADSPAGYEIDLSDLATAKARPIGIADGTIVSVTNLFHNIPARKAYYENKNSEQRKLIKLIGEEALINPAIGFRLVLNKKIALLLPKNQSIEERANYLLGTDLQQTHLAFNKQLENITIRGHISKPQYAAQSKETQYLFVNSRPVRNFEIASTIKRSFSTLIDVHSHPSFVIYIETPAELVDVNVHPRKREVLLLEKEKILQNIQTLVKSMLEVTDATYETTTHREADAYMASVLKDDSNLWNIKTNNQAEQYEEILQINKLYLVFETAQGMNVVDQHAAHERILYEEFLEHFEEKRSTAKSLDVNEIVEVPHDLLPLLEINIDTLEAQGFRMEVFRNNSYKITKIPEMFKTYDLKKLLLELLEDIATDQNYTADNKTLKTIAYLACRSAIKGGEYLTMEERKNLLLKLDYTKTKYTCPHGRPVKLVISKTELAKMFRRIK